MTINGYETKTTFWDDFSIADRFGRSAILDTYNLSSSEWKSNAVYMTELVMVLNWKCWDYYEKGNLTLSRLYSDLYYKADALASESLSGEDLAYYYSTSD